MFESLASCFAFRCSASLNMTRWRGSLRIEISLGLGCANLVIHERVFDLDTSQRYFSGMINVTDNAVRQLQSLLSQRPENSRKGLRVEVAKGGCSGLHYEMTLGEQEEGDAIVERDGVQFFIDDESVSYLRGATLDFTDGLTGTGFRIVNPNASRTCGCGTSFEAAQSA
jgi:iron-sulfur cluster assembly accessory protein